MREIIGAGVTVFLIVYMLYFVIPVGKTSYTNLLHSVNTTSPLMQQILPITDNWWIVFPFLIVIAGGYTIYSYATSRSAFDY